MHWHLQRDRFTGLLEAEVPVDERTEDYLPTIRRITKGFFVDNAAGNRSAECGSALPDEGDQENLGNPVSPIQATRYTAPVESETDRDWPGVSGLITLKAPIRHTALPRKSTIRLSNSPDCSTAFEISFSATMPTVPKNTALSCRLDRSLAGASVPVSAR